MGYFEFCNNVNNPAKNINNETKNKTMWTSLEVEAVRNLRFRFGPLPCKLAIIFSRRNKASGYIQPRHSAHYERHLFQVSRPGNSKGKAPS